MKALMQKIETLEQLLNLLGEMYAQEVDIHQHTRQIGEHYRAFQLAFDEYHDFFGIETDDLETVIKEIHEEMAQLGYTEEKKAQIQTILNTICSTPGVDEETGAKIQSLLIQSWALRGAYPNAADLLLHNLSHNIAAGGGCVACIAARLIQPYTHFLVATLRRLVGQDIMPIEYFQFNHDELELATAISLSEEEAKFSALEDSFEHDLLELQYQEILAFSKQSPEIEPILAQEYEDEALAKAIQNSLNW